MWGEGGVLLSVGGGRCAAECEVREVCWAPAVRQRSGLVDGSMR